MPTRVKICGITRAEDAELAIELGAAALGFNFYPQSPRYIAPETAWETVRNIPPFVTAVGVFADETDVAHVLAVAGESGVTAIQLHSPRFSAELYSAPAVGDEQSIGLDHPAMRIRPYPVILALRVDANFEPESLKGLRDRTFLLDAPHPRLKGGTGCTIDWTKAREATRYARVILAGGLTPENVGEAIRQVRPFGVDVASGVESSPGVKDATKLRAFFAAVRHADSM